MGDKINPWISIWTEPKKTIKALVLTNPKRGFFFLSSIWFLHFFFLFINFLYLPFFKYIILSIALVILSPFLGALFLSGISYLFFIIGKLLKGKANYLHIRCAFSWSRMPIILDLIIWFSIFVISSSSLLKIDILNTWNSFIFIKWIVVVTAIWAFILLVLAIKKIQRFSLLKTLINISIVYLILLIFILFGLVLFI